MKGVRVFVPYRTRSTETLEAFTVERETHALELMATSMPDTLLKLAHGGKRSGLREVIVRSIRTGRILRWRQEAASTRCRTPSVSIADGRPRWLEVKATTGNDGRFDWPRREFEKAFRERDRYELWWVYRVADSAPIAKCFPNPAKMLGTQQILLELDLLRAKIEYVG